MIFVSFLAFTMQAEAIQQSPTVPGVPARNYTEQSPEEEFRQGVRNLFDLLAAPDQRYNPFVYLNDKSRVTVVITRGGGLANAFEAIGDEGRQTLTKFFEPNPDVTFSFSAPQMEMDGAFGRAKLAIAITERGKRPQCALAYIDGVLLPPGEWAKYASQGMWRFTQITISSHFDGKCAT